MKIRTDFVTNSSSSSFVTYHIKSDKDKEKYEQLRLYLLKLSEKYGVNGVLNTYDGGNNLDFDKDKEIVVLNWTPGLSHNFSHLNRNYARSDGNYPPSAAVAIASLFGENGSNMHYLGGIDHTLHLIDENGHISSEVSTSLTEKEALRLEELLAGVKVTQKEIMGGTD